MAHDDGDPSDIRPALRRLGTEGLIDRGALAPRVDGIRTAAARSLDLAFSLWSQTMVLEYLRCSPCPAAGADLLAALADGTVTGATALAPAVDDLAGGAPLPVVAEPDGDGWRLSGTIPWASNLFADAVVVTPARAPDGRRLVALFRLTDDGADLLPSPPLLALDGTGTGSVRLRDVVLPGDAVLSIDLPGFMARCLPAMLLTQTALAAGLAAAALAAAAPRLDGAFTADHRALADRQADVGNRLGRLAGRPSQAAPPELARLRLDAMRVAGDAVRLEGAVSGGTGFRAASPTARRIREAAFLPVQAPTEARLRVLAGD